MKSMTMGGVSLLVAAFALPAAAREDEATKVSFEVRKVKGDSQIDALKKELAAVEGVDTVDVIADCTVHLTVKEKGSVKLSDLRDAVAKAGEEIEIKEDGIVLTGKVWIWTRFTDALAAKGLDVLKKLESVENVEPLVKVPEKEGNGYELTTKGAKGIKLGDLGAALQNVFEKKSLKAVVDVTWFAAEKKGGKKHG